MQKARLFQEVIPGNFSAGEIRVILKKIRLDLSGPDGMTQYQWLVTGL